PVGGKVDHGGLLCPRQAVRGIVVRVCHVAARTLRWVGMPARVHTYVEEACAVVNTGGGVRRPLTTPGSGKRPQCRVGSCPPLLLRHDAALCVFSRACRARTSRQPAALYACDASAGTARLFASHELCVDVSSGSDVYRFSQF